MGDNHPMEIVFQLLDHSKGFEVILSGGIGSICGK